MFRVEEIILLILFVFWFIKSGIFFFVFKKKELIFWIGIEFLVNKVVFLGIILIIFWIICFLNYFWSEVSVFKVCVVWVLIFFYRFSYEVDFFWFVERCLISFL